MNINRTFSCCSLEFHAFFQESAVLINSWIERRLFCNFTVMLKLNLLFVVSKPYRDKSNILSNIDSFIFYFKNLLAIIKRLSSNILI